MAYSYDEYQGEPKSSAEHHPEDTRLAGDVIDMSSTFSNMQQSNAITRSLDRANQERKPKASVTPIKRS